MPNGELATIESIPPEILCDIFSFAFPDCQDPSSLVSASRVCRRWRHPAQRTLFERCDFYYVASNDRICLSEWAASAAHARYPLRTLNVSDRTLKAWLLCAPEGCRGVRTLGFTAGDFPDWSILEHPSLSDLRSLSIACSVYGTSPSPPSFPFHLRELSLDLNLSGANAAPILESLFSASHDTLDTLSLTHRSTDAHLPVHDLSTMPFFRLTAPTLRRLHLDLTFHATLLLNILPWCTNLSILSVCLSPRSKREGTLAELAAHLPSPPTVKRVVVNKRYLEDKDVIEDVSKFLRLPALVGVKRVEFPTLERSVLGRSDSLALVQESEARGIFLACRGESL